jgi:predicted nucleotidyltransferase
MKINVVKEAAERIREDLKLAAKRQEQEHDRDMDIQAKAKEGMSIDKSVELVKEIEDILDIEEIKERMA